MQTFYCLKKTARGNLYVAKAVANKAFNKYNSLFIKKHVNEMLLVSTWLQKPTQHDVELATQIGNYR